MFRLLLIAFAALVLASTAEAHSPATGPNGGKVVHAGTNYHVELVANGGTQVVLHLADADDKPLPSTGFRANAILVINGQTVRFPLQAAEGSRLVGTAPVAVPAGVRGAIQIITPQGATIQARY